MAIAQNRGIFPDSGVGGGNLAPINPTGTNTAMPGSASALGAGGTSFPVNTAVPQYTPQQLGMSAMPDASQFTAANGYSLSREAAQALLAQQTGAFNPDQLTYLNNQINGLSPQDIITQQLTSSNPQIAAALQQQGIPINSQNVDNYIWKNPQYQTPEWRAQQQRNFGGGATTYNGAGYTQQSQGQPSTQVGMPSTQGGLPTMLTPGSYTGDDYSYGSIPIGETQETIARQQQLQQPGYTPTYAPDPNPPSAAPMPYNAGITNLGIIRNQPGSQPRGVGTFVAPNPSGDIGPGVLGDTGVGSGGGSSLPQGYILDPTWNGQGTQQIVQSNPGNYTGDPLSSGFYNAGNNWGGFGSLENAQASIRAQNYTTTTQLPGYVQAGATEDGTMLYGPPQGYNFNTQQAGSTAIIPAQGTGATNPTRPAGGLRQGPSVRTGNEADGGTNTITPGIQNTITPPTLVGNGTIDGGTPPATGLVPSGGTSGGTTGFGNFSTGLPTSGLNGLNVGQLLGKGADTAGLVSSLDNLFGKGVGSTVAAFLQNGAGYNPDVVTALTNAFEPYKEEGLAAIKQSFGAQGSADSSASALGQEKFLRDLALGDQSILAGQYNNSVSNYAGMLNNTLQSAAAEQANKLNPLDYINGILGSLSSTGLLDKLLSKIPGLNSNTATGGTGTGGAGGRGGDTNIYIDSNGQIKVQPKGNPGDTTGGTKPPPKTDPPPPVIKFPPGTPPPPPPISNPGKQPPPTGGSTSNIKFDQRINDDMTALGITDPNTAQWFGGLDSGLQDYLAKNPNIFNDINPQREITPGDNHFNDWLADPIYGPMLEELGLGFGSPSGDPFGGFGAGGDGFGLGDTFGDLFGDGTLPPDPGPNGDVYPPNPWQWYDPGDNGYGGWDDWDGLFGEGTFGGDYNPGQTLE